MVAKNRPVHTGSQINLGIVSEKPRQGRPIAATKAPPANQAIDQEETQTPPPVSDLPETPAEPAENSSGQEDDWDIPAFLRQGR